MRFKVLLHFNEFHCNLRLRDRRVEGGYPSDTGSFSASGVHGNGLDIANSSVEPLRRRNLGEHNKSTFYSRQVLPLAPERFQFSEGLSLKALK